MTSETGEPTLGNAILMIFAVIVGIVFLGLIYTYYYTWWAGYDSPVIGAVVTTLLTLCVL